MLISVFELKYSILLKIWLAYPLFCCTFILISVCNDRALTGEQMVLQMDLWKIIWN